MPIGILFLQKNFFMLKSKYAKAEKREYNNGVVAFATILSSFCLGRPIIPFSLIFYTFIYKIAFYQYDIHKNQYFDSNR